MLGRTNAGDGGIILNATIEPKEVATGNTITAGNFVEYLTSSPEISFGDSQINAGLKRISSSLAVGIFSNQLRLIKIDGPNSEMLSTYTDYYVYDFDVSDGVVYAITGNSSSDVSSKQITKISIVDDELITEQTLNVTNTSKYCICMNGFLVAVYTYKDGSIYRYMITTIDISQSTMSVSHSTASTAYGREKMSPYCLSFSGNDLYMLSYSEESHEFILNVITISSDGSINVGANVILERYTGYNTSLLVGYSEVVGNELRISFRKGNTVEFFIYNIQTQTKTVITIPDVISADQESVLYSLGQNLYVSSLATLSGSTITTYIRVIKYDPNQSSISNNSNTFSIESRYGMYPYVDGNEIYTFEKGMLVSHADNNFSHITANVETDYVLNWSGSGNPIGVAKDSGSAGQTINVYVPSV